MKTIKVVAAIILNDNNEIFVCQRGYGKFKGLWEFPGGKIEENETYENALKREIKEELNMDIEVLNLFDTIEYDYEDFHLSMRCYISKIIKGEPILNEHLGACFVNKTELHKLNWVPADVGLIEKLKSV